jgi:uncharacterized ParB-like nuclease family protein
MTDSYGHTALVKKLNEAESFLISMKELSVQADFQMRSEMDHSVIDDYADNLAHLPPVHVFEVTTGEYTKLMLTDGFHRFFAHEKAGSEDIIAKVIKGTREEAIQYAMAANFAHLKGGSKPSASDQKNAIETLCKAMMEGFGYDAKAVVPALRRVGVKASRRWLEKCTAQVREQITARRNAKISKMLAEGHAQKEIAEAVGMSTSGLGDFLKKVTAPDEIRKAHSAKTGFSADEIGNPEFVGFEDEEGEAPVINPAEAQQEALEQLENNRQAREKIPAQEVEAAFDMLIGAWKKHGKATFDDYLTDDNEARAASRAEFLKIMKFAANRIA